MPYDGKFYQRRRHGVGVAGAGGDHEDPDDRGDDPDHGHEEREDESFRAEGDPAQDEGGDEDHRVRLEQVGGHARAVADVVAHVVRDSGGIAGVVFGDVVFDFAYQVGADVSRLGEDSAADPHEHGEQGRAEPEAFQDDRGVGPVDEDYESCAEQAEADGEHAGDTAGAEGDPHGSSCFSGAGGRGDAEVAAHGEPHAEEPGHRGEERADREEDGASPADGFRVCGQQEKQQGNDNDKDREGAELAFEIGSRAFLDRSCDILHALCALACGENLTHEGPGNSQREQCHRENHDDEREIHTEQSELGAAVSGKVEPGQSVLLQTGRAPPGCSLRRPGLSGRVALQHVRRGLAGASMVGKIPIVSVVLTDSMCRESTHRYPEM